MFQHTPYDIHPDHLNKWFLSFSEVFKGMCGVCSNGITSTRWSHQVPPLKPWNLQLSRPISGYLLLTVQRRSLKSTLPAEKGQLWVSWLAKISTFCGNKTEGFWCVDTTPGGFWCAGRIWGYTSLKNSGSWFSSLSMENASTNQSFSGVGCTWRALASTASQTISKIVACLIWAVTCSPWLPVYNYDFDIQKKQKSSNIHVSLALSPNPSNSHHQDDYLFIYTYVK